MELKCPNCLTPAAAKDGGDRLVCSQCGGTFEFKAGESRLTAMKDFDALRADVEELKKRLPGSQPAAVEPAEEPTGKDEEETEEEEEI